MTGQTQAKEEKIISDIFEGIKKKPAEILEITNKLHDQDEFGLARRMLEQVINRSVDNNTDKKKIIQKWALSTYKDTHLNRKKALDQAIDILQTEFDLAKIKDQETLGIAGAIFKRKWAISGIKVHLEQSLIYYLRGFEQGIKKDNGYTAINAAFIQDQLASLENKQATQLGTTSDVAIERKRDAQEIRQQVINYLSESLKNAKIEKDNYWPIVTLAEAFFGVEKYSEAEKWLDKAREISEFSDWERVSTAKQLVYLAKLQAKSNISELEFEKTKAWKVLNNFMDGKAIAIHSMHRGKVGLALSGGGFRASFYHIGVLAKLAELDLLRHIEVLSCVSGGSILGTYYYLELRRLINVEKKTDKEIDRTDYVKIINSMVDNFILGVQDNPRVRVLANPLDNLKMIFSSSYSRTKRLGELYEKKIYSRILDGEETGERWLNGLYIHPTDAEDDKQFLPKRDNWFRKCKIPELIINATTLNTGHNWQFTASWMGESPTQIDPDVDTNDRYRRTYYQDAPEPYKKIRLGTAVGASSCVPGLFEPIVLQGLYKDTTVRLIDGGVYDNQGVSGLIEQDCNVIISSDAAGSLNTEKDPGGGILKPLLRTNVTLMQRVRNSQYQDLKARETAGILKGFSYVHLKQGLKGKNIDWIDSEELEESQADVNAKTNYGIRKDIQELLAGVRTDLDSFSDLEAYALMTSGYCAIEESIAQSLNDFPMEHDERLAWKFLSVEPAMKQDEAEGEDYQRLKTNLEASTLTFGKVWKLDKTLNQLRTLIIILAILCLAYIWYSYPSWQPLGSLTLNMIMLPIVTLLLSSLAAEYLDKHKVATVKQVLNFRDIPRRIFVGAGVGLFGWVGAFIHLHYFDKKFKSMGKMK